MIALFDSQWFIHFGFSILCYKLELQVNIIVNNYVTTATDTSSQASRLQDAASTEETVYRQSDFGQTPGDVLAVFVSSFALLMKC